MPVVLIMTDFDGTITGIPGFNVVNSNFFRLLTVPNNEGAPFDYSVTKMKSESEIDALFVKEFGEYALRQTEAKGDRRFLMTDEVVRFMQEALSSDEVRVHIITLNRDEYVRAQFRYHGFTPTEIGKLKISAMLNKEHVVFHDLALFNKDQIAQIYVLDDSLTDFNAMTKAVTNQSLGERLIAYNKSPGSFLWDCYLQDIKTTLSKVNTLETEQTPIAPSTYNGSFFSEGQIDVPVSDVNTTPGVDLGKS